MKCFEREDEIETGEIKFRWQIRRAEINYGRSGKRTQVKRTVVWSSYLN